MVEMTRDLTDPRWIIAKGVLFLFLGLISAALLLSRNLSWQEAALLGVSVWAFCRAYYFAFYVIEKYVDPNYRFSGVGSALAYLVKRSDKTNSQH
jgi:hypothetical protein